MAKLNPFAGDYQGLLDQFSATRRNGESLAADLSEEEGDIIVEMDLAGVDPDNVDIWIEGNQLYVNGYREEIAEDEDRNYYMKEIRYGSFERVIPLPAEVEAEEADASFEDGVLSITLPKIEEEKKQIASSKAKKKTGAKTAKKSASSAKKAGAKGASKTTSKKAAPKTSAKKTSANKSNSKTAKKSASSAKKAGSKAAKSNKSSARSKNESNKRGNNKNKQ